MAVSKHTVKLVATTGQEKGVVLRIQRDGLWLFTEGGKEIQLLPYQHIVKWLPSNLRSKDPGPDDCLDVQVETTSGKKDLRMRCADVQSVQTIISDIRSTVQSIMTELDSSKAATTAAGPDKAELSSMHATVDRKQRQHSSSPGNTTAPGHQKHSDHQQQQQQQQQTAPQPRQQQQQQPETLQQAGRSPLLERQVQQHQLDLQEPPLQQYSMKLALPLHHQQQQQDAAFPDVLTPVEQQQQQQQQQQLLQQQLQASKHVQPPNTQQPEALMPQQQQQQQGYIQQDSPGAMHVTSSWHRTSPSRPTTVRASIDTSGIAGSRSSPIAAHSASLLRHSLPNAVTTGVLPAGGNTLQAALFSKETELEAPAAAAAGAAAGSKRGAPAVDLAKLGVSMTAAEGWQQAGAVAAAGSSETAAQIRLLEDMVKRLSGELAARLAADGLQSSQEALPSASVAAALGDADVQLPPWMKDSRYLTPLLAAYDDRIAAAQAEADGRAQAAKDIQAQVKALVSENESLHDQLAKATARLAGSTAADRAAVAAVTDTDKLRLQERLELLETENDLLLAQQGDLEEEILRLGKLLQDKDSQVVQLQAAAAAAGAHVSSLRGRLTEAEHNSSGARELREQIKDLTSQLASESSRAAAALAAADAAAAAQAAAERQLAASQAASRSTDSLETEVARARSAADAAAAESVALSVEADSLRKALRAMEARLAEYQAKDTEVYLRIKAAMELAEEARLERDAATSTTAALRQQLEATQARLADATKQLLGGTAADGGLGAAELRQRLAAAEREGSRANKALTEAEAKVAELQAASAKLARDKASLTAELTTLRDELGCCCCGAGGGGSSRSQLSTSPIGTPGRLRAEMLSERLSDAERQRDEVMQRLDSCKRAAARAEKDWELERNNLHAEVQRLTRRVTAAEAAASAASASAAESRQAGAAAEAELLSLRDAAARAEAGLRAQLADSRAARDAEVSGLASKLERALSACDKAVSDAEEMMASKDGLLAEWKKEAQLVSRKLDAVLQQQAAEREELQGQVQSCTQQLAEAQDEVALLQQELDAARAACAEGDVLLQEAEARLAAVQTAAAAKQEQALQEAADLQGQLERAHLEQLKAQRQRDSLAAKLERLLGPIAAAAAASQHHSNTTGPAAGGGDTASPPL